MCIFCRGILRNWEPDDIPDSEHSRHFGSCPFVLDPSGTSNVALGSEHKKKQLGVTVSASFTGCLNKFIRLIEVYTETVYNYLHAHNIY